MPLLSLLPCASLLRRLCNLGCYWVRLFYTRAEEVNQRARECEEQVDIHAVPYAEKMTQHDTDRIYKTCQWGTSGSSETRPRTSTGLALTLLCLRPSPRLPSSMSPPTTEHVDSPEYFDSLADLATYCTSPRVINCHAAPKVPLELSPTPNGGSRLYVCHDYKVRL